MGREGEERGGKGRKRKRKRKREKKEIRTQRDTRETTWRPGKKVTIYKTRREAPRRNHPCSYLFILDLEPPEL
jgi:hypothetical protein